MAPNVLFLLNSCIPATSWTRPPGSSGSTGSVQVQPTTAGVHATANAGPAAPDIGADISASGEQTLGDTLGISLAELATYPGSATVYTLQLIQDLMPQILPPGVSADVGLQQLIDSGTLQIGEDGDDVRVDLGTMTVQIVSLERDPTVSAQVMGTTISGGALAGVPNNGEPTSSDSTGVVQAGGGNSSQDSVGVVTPL